MAHANRAKAALASGDTVTAQNEVDTAIASSAKARDQAHSAPLSWIGASPVVGRPVDMLQGMTAVANDTLVTVVKPLSTVNISAAFKSAGAPGVDVGVIRDAIPTIHSTAQAATALAARAEAIPHLSSLSILENARAELTTTSAELAHTLETLATITPVLPGLLGGDGERTYLMVFQGTAEARGTGGLLGGTAVLHVRDGKITIDQSAKNSDLKPVTGTTDLGPDFQAMYGKWKPDTNPQNANFSPHFPYAATLWSSIWSQHYGVAPDGVIATDPVALSYLLAATGPITVAGENVDATNVVALTLNELYFRYGGDNQSQLRKDHLQMISRSVIEAIMTSKSPKSAVLTALGRAVDEQRLMMWSRIPAEQAALAATPLGHAVPDDDSPYASVILNNGQGGKLDYYLERKISYQAGPCEGEQRSSTITAKLTNTAPNRDYPPYLYGRQSPETQYGGPPGTNRTVVSVFATADATFESMTVNGVPALTQRSNERGHPVFSTVVLTKPGATTEIVLSLKEPTVAGEARVPVQPLTRDATVDVSVPTC